MLIQYTGSLYRGIPVSQQGKEMGKVELISYLNRSNLMQVHLPGCCGSEGSVKWWHVIFQAEWEECGSSFLSWDPLRSADDFHGCSHSSSWQRRHPPSANSFTQNTRGISLQVPAQWNSTNTYVNTPEGALQGEGDDGNSTAISRQEYLFLHIITAVGSTWSSR